MKNENMNDTDISFNKEGGDKIISILKEAILHAGFNVLLEKISIIKEHEFCVERAWKPNIEQTPIIPNDVVCGVVDDILTKLENYRTPNNGTAVYGINIFNTIETIQFGKAGIVVTVRIARDFAQLVRNDVEGSKQEDSPAH